MRTTDAVSREEEFRSCRSSGVAEWGTLETEPKPLLEKVSRAPNAYPSAVELNRRIIHKFCNS
jgi:hypothetical protein